MSRVITAFGIKQSREVVRESVKAWRIKNDFSAKQAADVLGVGLRTYYRLESTDNPIPRVCLKCVYDKINEK